MQRIVLGRKNSIFHRLIIVFLLVMIPIYILAVNIYYWGINTIKNEILDSLKAQNTFYLNNLESEIERIKKMQYDCINDDDLNNLAYASQLMDDIEMTYAIKRLQKRLTVINDSSIYIKGVCAYIPAISMTIYSDGNPSGSINDIPKAEFDMLKVLPNDSEAQIIYWQNRLFMSSVNPTITSIGLQSIPFIIGIELNKREFSNVLMKSDIYTGSGALLINNTNNDVISKTSNNIESDNVQSFPSNIIKMHSNGTDRIKIGNKHYLIVFTTSKYLNMSLIKYVLEGDVFKKLEKYRLMFIFLSLAAVIICGFYAIATYGFIHKPLIRLVRSFKQIENGDLNVKIGHNRDDEFGYLYNGFNKMVENLQTLINQVYEQNILMQKAELKQLQSQINPHFLYNSFYILQRMIVLEDNANAVKFAKQLGNYFKFITRSSADEVPLEKEVEHARIYANIQGMRFARRLSVEFEDLPENMMNVIVPRLILQPIIENAFEHGLKSKEKDGLLLVRFKYTENIFQISVEDNGNEMCDKKIRQITDRLEAGDSREEITGIINIHKRIRLKFGKNSGLSVAPSEIGGLKVIIHIELQGKEEIDNVSLANC
ncbi:MAG TPA: histidine kinase [Clostridiaceae bacterium]|nr:histidine kinase [Clostridiaceae bacterium]